ncbi:MAG: hypothetical protein AAB834_04260, partial [Patescibacteria group bacterium]
MTVRPFHSQIRIAAAVGISLLVVALGGQAIAQQNTAVSRGFKATDKEIVQGALVSTAADDSSSVELAVTQSASRLAGVVSKTTLVEL